ncbi:MAG: hypothetical protein ACOYXC_06755 [Candidatus Rifleibacteriota bacterium]
MNTSFQTFKENLRQQMLRILWSGWTQLGVAGFDSKPWSSAADVEALILTTCFWGRYDQRLFDEMISWLISNERLINIQRLQSIIKKESFHESRLMGPICRMLARKKATPKWRGIESKLRKLSSENNFSLFLLPDNRPLPIVGKTDDDFAAYGFLRLPFIDRGMNSVFRAGKPAALQLQLRAFFGVGSRAEIMLALLLKNSASISEIASNSYYSWKSIQDALFEMSISGLVTHPPAKKERRYSLANENWAGIFLSQPENVTETTNWCKFFSAIEILWKKLDDKKISNLPVQTMEIELADIVQTRLHKLFAASDSRIRIPDYAMVSGD